MLTGSVYVRSDPHPEVASMDAYTGHLALLDWADLRAAAGNSKSDTSDFLLCTVVSASTLNKWWSMKRSIILFDTTNKVPTDATITSATLSLFAWSSFEKPASWSPSLNLYASSPASNTAAANGDFATLGDTPLATAIPYASLLTSRWNVLTLNATGLAAISRTGITKFGLREATYDGANVEPPWVNNEACTLTFFSADSAAGGGNPPVLRINYTLESDHTVDIITLQAVRNMEMTTMGRFYIDEQGNAKYESRYARNG